MGDEFKRVLIVGPTPPPFHGVAVFIRDILAGAQAFQPWLVEHLDTSDRRDAENLGRWDADNLILGFSNLAQLAARLLRHRHRLVYIPISQNIPAFLRDAWFIMSARLLGARVAVQLHGGYFRTFYEQSPGWFRALARFTLRRAAVLIVLSEEFRPIFSGLVDAEKIHVVENGVPDLFADCACPAEINLEKSRTLLYLGTLNRTKGILELLEAVALLSADMPDLRLRIAGQWSEPDARAEAEALIARHDLGARIEFIGNVDGAAKREFLTSGALFCLPTRYPFEGQPLVLLEAMSAGLPVLSTRHGAIASTVGDGVSGCLLDTPVTPAKLAQSLRDMLADPVALKRMGAAGRERFLQRYTLAVCHARLKAVFDLALK